MNVRRAAAAVLAGLLILLTGYLFDAAPLFVVAVAFVALGLLAPAWVWVSARGTSVSRRLERDRVVEGEPLEAWLELRAGPLRLPGGEVRDPLLSEPVRIPGGRRASVRMLAQFDRRGRRRLPPPELRVRDPLELAARVCPGASPAQDVLVLPRTEGVQWAGRGGQGASSAAARARAELLAAVEVDGLRPYRRGTPASRIHWPALARGAGLLERRLRVDGDTLPLVVVDARGSGPEAHLDQAVRAAASLTLELARAGGCRLLLPGARRAMTVETDLASWPSAHVRLAMVEGGPEARAPSPAATRSALGLLFYVTSQRLARMPAALGREAAAAGLTVLVVPAAVTPPGRGTPSLAVSGCLGFALGAARRPASRPPLRNQAAA
jgi:uncharacterized protein (DUF58 family)